MLAINIPIINKSERVIPTYATKGSVGFDIYPLDKQTVVKPKERVLVHTGLYMAIPIGYELQIRPKSGTSLKTSLWIPNSPGTIDSDYRGEICIIVSNDSEYPITFDNTKAIAQGVINEVWKAIFQEVEELPETDRGTGGFGSTNK